jgi:hypothetical protein
MKIPELEDETYILRRRMPLAGYRVRERQNVDC